MNKLKEDIANIEKEIEKIKNRDELETETFQKIVRRRKEVWNAYFLDCLTKEKNTFEYINQVVDEQINIGFKKAFSKIKRLQEKVDELETERNTYTTPMTFEKLVEWTKEEDTLSELFVMPVKISDIKKLLKECVLVATGEGGSE